MFSSRVVKVSLARGKSLFNLQQRRNVQVTVVGAANTVGSNASMLLKKNPKISRLNLYDFDYKVQGLAKELSVLPGGPCVCAFAGPEELEAAVMNSKLILMLSDACAAAEDVHSEAQAELNAPLVEAVCKAMAARNKDAFLGIATHPINVMVPYAFAVLLKYNSLNPFKVFGITGSDEGRAKSLAANLMKVNPRHLSVPVIGGHSPESIVPLFSNLTPHFYSLDSREIASLTSMMRTGIPKNTCNKEFGDHALLSTAWAVNEFAQKIIETFFGTETTLHSYTANPHFGTRFFSGPVVVGPYGLVRAPSTFEMTPLECELLGEAVIRINRDVDIAERLVAKLFDLQPLNA